MGVVEELVVQFRPVPSAEQKGFERESRAKKSRRKNKRRWSRGKKRARARLVVLEEDASRGQVDVAHFGDPLQLLQHLLFDRILGDHLIGK